ncbi:hypothetical protein B0H66DRAFT_607876 [Apodospora peruviana]|uniref:CFEM domain-containing protein n=1 Tax=Apodospora peruviana TaxID=516989 RepID=A0AAE0HTX3_9PEZI|nr:hypothetical protein B0H66DRAFT_607876 [Apodospora peruviana]
MHPSLQSRSVTALVAGLLAASSTLVLAQSATPSLFITIPTTGAGSVPTNLPTPNDDLPGLVSKIPDCAIACFSSAAATLNCGPADFACLCKSDNIQSFSLNIASCLSGGLGGDKKPTDDACSLTNLATVAGEICAEVNASNPNQSELAAATSVVSEKLASASKTASTPSSTSSSAAGGNKAPPARPEGAAMGMLAVVAAYAVLAL